jgi:hypothetical protein
LIGGAGGAGTLAQIGATAGYGQTVAPSGGGGGGGITVPSTARRGGDGRAAGLYALTDAADMPLITTGAYGAAGGGAGTAGGAATLAAPFQNAGGAGAGGRRRGRERARGD